MVAARWNHERTSQLNPAAHPFNPSFEGIGITFGGGMDLRDLVGKLQESENVSSV